MSKPESRNDAELTVLAKMYLLLQPFDFPAQTRIVKYLRIRVMDDEERRPDKDKSNYDPNFSLSGLHNEVEP